MTDPLETPAPPATPSERERTWAMLAHLSALTGLVVPMVGVVIGPLVVWLARRDDSPFVAAHALEALNFNLTVLLAAVVCVLLMLVFVGFLLGTALFVAWLVFTLVAAIKASEGENYRYPFSLRLVR
ncbi:MAG: DUF4870 domain-containing protein [Gammaproteobacteria bacterium]|nr:DUF4870 domain-containing protein [Gammaproteobacteria bacterium]